MTAHQARTSLTGPFMPPGPPPWKGFVLTLALCAMVALAYWVGGP